MIFLFFYYISIFMSPDINHSFYKTMEELGPALLLGARRQPPRIAVQLRGQPRASTMQTQLAT